MVNTRTGGGRDVPSQRRDHVVNQQNQAPPPPPPQPAMDPAMQQFLATQMQLIQQLTQTVANLQAQQNQQPPPPPEPVQPPRDHHRQFLSQHPPTYCHSADPLDADDWLKNVAKKLNIAQCTDREKVLYASGRLEGPAADWWDAYINAHNAPDTITWQQFQDVFRTHHIPAGVDRQATLVLATILHKVTRIAQEVMVDITNRDRRYNILVNSIRIVLAMAPRQCGSTIQLRQYHPMVALNAVMWTPQTQRSDGQRSAQPSSQQGNKGQQNFARGRVNHVTAESAQEANDVVLGTFLLSPSIRAGGAIAASPHCPPLAPPPLSRHCNSNSQPQIPYPKNTGALPPFRTWPRSSLTQHQLPSILLLPVHTPQRRQGTRTVQTPSQPAATTSLQLRTNLLGQATITDSTTHLGPFPHGHHRRLRFAVSSTSTANQ
nr:unnamed protein product [Digitaria exilis]